MAVEVASTIDSTQTRARALLEAGQTPLPLVVIADTQTGGQGQRGRVWASPKGGLYLSIAIALPEPVPAMPLTIPAALAVADAIESVTTGLTVKLKWPNDLWIGERKISGVLAHVVTGARGRAVVLGLGVNVRVGAGELPPDLRETATSLQILLPDAAPTPLEVLRALALALRVRLQAWQAHDHEAARSQAWQRSVLRGGRSFRVSHGAGANEAAYRARAEGLGADGRLRVRRLDDDSPVELLSATIQVDAAPEASP
ncbi:MAG: biotin--[acetyl-CoA-carboxylase] ligase [Planctomycetota bacterium]|jgi:biotin-[acetyl-CoA-carboxylase] ligase BirA-like protein